MYKYNCKKTSRNLLINGKLDKPEWEAAEEIELVDTVSGEKPRQLTSAKLLYNDSFIYVGFCCEDDYICAKMTEYNDKLYEEEVVEIFIDDDGDLKTYTEIEVNPLNVVLHYVVHNDLKGFHSGYAKVIKNVETAVWHDKINNIWTTEIAIPFQEFVAAGNIPPCSGDVWRMNLYRIDKSKDGSEEYTAWSPTGLINYHMPHKFGKLIFN